MINLPAAFTERMKQMLGREYDAFIASYDKERSQGLRVNGLKTNPAEFAKTAPFSLNPVAWATEGFAYGAEDRPGRHPYHDAGVYYIQEPSAMIAASLLNDSGSLCGTGRKIDAGGGETGRRRTSGEQ